MSDKSDLHVVEVGVFIPTLVARMEMRTAAERVLRIRMEVA